MNTPGPWHVNYERELDGSIQGVVYTKPKEPTHPIRHIVSIGVQDNSDRNNLKLVAAAPELLALAEEFKLLLEELKSVDGIDLQSTAMKVKSALMRAKGQI